MLTEAGIVLEMLLERRRAMRADPAAFFEARLGRFRRLVGFASRRSPYYADIIKERGLTIESCLPTDFPVLTKTELMANFDRLVTDPAVTREAVSAFLTRSKDPAELFRERYRVMHTSGTSGEVGYFLYSRADWLRGMFGAGYRRRARRPRLQRVRKGRYRFAFYGATGGHFAGVTMATATRSGLARLFVETETFEINRPLSETIAELNVFQPDIVSGYTTALRILGEKQQEGVLKISPMAIAATGETVTKNDVAFLKSAFGCDVASAYGCTEHLGLGVSDPDGETMTLNDSNLIFEFFEDHSLITNLFNYTMPLIRYRMSDVLVPAGAVDAHPLTIKNLVGRTERAPMFDNDDGVKDFISPHTINEIYVAGVARFQLRLVGPSSFRFLVVLDPTLSTEAADDALAGVDARLRDILAQKRMSAVTFKVERVVALGVNPRTRKFQLIVDDTASSALGGDNAASPGPS